MWWNEEIEFENDEMSSIPKTEVAEEEKEQETNPLSAFAANSALFELHDLYLVDSEFSREDNKKLLFSEYGIEVDEEKSSQNHLVWANLSYLSKRRIDLFERMNHSGLGILINHKIWEEPVNDGPGDIMKVAKNFTELMTSKTVQKQVIEKMANIIMYYDEHFDITNEMLPRIDFQVQTRHSDERNLGNAYNLSAALLAKLPELSREQNLDWTFNAYRPNDPNTKFRIELNVGSNSYYMGFKLIEWRTMYPFVTTMRFGSPIQDIVKLLDIKENMEVLDLDAGYGEHLIEIAKTVNCSAIGWFEKKILSDRFEINLDSAKLPDESTSGLGIVQFAMRYFNEKHANDDMKTKNRVLYRHTKMLTPKDVNQLFENLIKIIYSCSPGTIFVFTFLPSFEFREATEHYFLKDDRLDVQMNMIYTEVAGRHRLVKIVLKE